MTAEPYKSSRKPQQEEKFHVTRQKRKRHHQYYAQHRALLGGNAARHLGSPDRDMPLGNLRLLQNAAAERSRISGPDGGCDYTVAWSERGEGRTTDQPQSRGTRRRQRQDQEDRVDIPHRPVRRLF